MAINRVLHEHSPLTQILHTFVADPTHGLLLQDVSLLDDILLCNSSTGRSRPVVPASWRRCVLDTLHGLSHPSVAGRAPAHHKKVRVASHHCRRFRIVEIVSASSQASKIHRHMQAPIADFPSPSKRFFSMFMSTLSAPYRCPMATHTS